VVGGRRAKRGGGGRYVSERVKTRTVGRFDALPSAVLLCTWFRFRVWVWAFGIYSV
jgi:hypothetical protein